MQKQRTIEQKLERLKVTLEAQQRHIGRLGPQDSDLLSILRAEQQIILTEIAALNWVLEDSREDVPSAYRNSPHHLPVAAGRWSPAGYGMSQYSVSCADAPGIGRPQMVF